MRNIVKENLKQLLKYNKHYQRYRMKKSKRSFDSDLCIIYLERTKGKVGQLEDMMQKIKINLRPDRRFQHWLDEKICIYNEHKVIGNVPPDYSLILEHSLSELIEEYGSGSEYEQNCRQLLQAVEGYIDKILSRLQETEQTAFIQNSTQYFENMKTGKADSLEEALQRIIFWSSLFWQSGHKLIGLGRLDKLLGRFVEKDISALDEPESYLEILKDFLQTLHEHYAYKSSQLLGDIGQIIILGGIEENGSYFCNSLTYLFIQALMDTYIPDPKILLRCSNFMPQDLMNLATRCIATGIGSPLLSNDEVVIPTLIDFGYSTRDAYNYVTSACWEPVSYGNSLEQNNLRNINFALPFVQTMCDKSVTRVKNYKMFLDLYLKKLQEHVQDILQQLSFIKWEPDPLFSFFTKDCKEKGLDISEGGAIYNNYGILSVGMGNAVNSLMNIKKIVFEQREVSLSKLHRLWRNSNRNALINLSEVFDISQKFYGHDTEENIALTNLIINSVLKVTTTYRNRYGGRVKFGLSSPDYVNHGARTDYTFDGRKKEEPLMVHISTNDNVAYTELISFASQIHYNGWNSNANVIDFFVSPNFIQSNLEKFVQFLFLSIQKGFFQMQMNVVSSATLIAAKKNPDKFPGLIVRVWGFSAYFKDLPEEYQEVLIQRALTSEGKEAT